MTRAISSLRASSISRSAFDPGLGLDLLAALLDDPGEQVGDRAELGDVVGAEDAMLLRLDVEDADDLVVPGQRHGQHRRDVAALVEAADPQEARLRADVRDDERLARRGDVAGHALAVRHPRPPDLEAIEAGRRGERQVRSIAVEEVEGGDVGVERIAGAVDDGLEQLVPRPRGRREARDLVQEAELRELIRLLQARARVDVRGRHVDHDTSVEKERPVEGCGGVLGAVRNGAGARVPA